MKIFAAVIEWPATLDSADPTLILSTSIEQRDAEVADEILETAEVLTEPDWLIQIQESESNKWSDWLDALDATPYGRPWVTTYEKEISA